MKTRLATMRPCVKDCRHYVCWWLRERVAS